MGWGGQKPITKPNFGGPTGQMLPELAIRRGEKNWKLGYVPTRWLYYVRHPQITPMLFNPISTFVLA